jgi:hypothetical protein
MRKTLTLFACLAAGLTLTSCIPESEHPLSRLEDAAQDESLIGLWVQEEPNEVHYVHIGAEVEKAVRRESDAPEPGLMRLWFVTHRKENGKARIETPFAMRFFVSKLGDDHYVNGVLPLEDWRPQEGPSAPTKFLFMKYKLDGDRLSVWFMDFQATAAVIEAGGLGGTVTREGKELKSAELTASTEQLATFLKNGGAGKLFPEANKNVYRRAR